MVSSNMWNWVTGPDGAMVCVPNHGRQQEWKEAGNWSSDMLRGTRPQTPQMIRTKKLSPWKLNGPFPKGPPSQQAASSRVATPMARSLQPSPQGSRVGTAMSGASPRTVGEGGTPRIAGKWPPSASVVASFQVRFPGDPVVYDFKSWEAINTEFERRGFDPRHANIHTYNKGQSRPNTTGMGSRRGKSGHNETSYSDMSRTINSLAMTGQSPYRNVRPLLPITRAEVDPLHFYGSVNGSPIPMLKAAPRLPRSPPKSPPRSPTNLSAVAEALLLSKPLSVPGVRTPTTVKKDTSVRPFVPRT